VKENFCANKDLVFVDVLVEWIRKLWYFFGVDPRAQKPVMNRSGSTSLHGKKRITESKMHSSNLLHLVFLVIILDNTKSVDPDVSHVQPTGHPDSVTVGVW
jgi:hypothetical protein